MVWKASEFDISGTLSPLRSRFRCQCPIRTEGFLDSFWGWRTQTSAIGVASVGGWPCGQDSRPRPECRQRRNRAPGGGRLEAGLTGFDCRAGWGYFDRADTALVVAALSR